MTGSVNLYLASGVSNGIGFWLIDFTDEEKILDYHSINLLECYRKELFGLEGAIEVKKAINTTLDILTYDSKFDQLKLDNLDTCYSSEIPINIMEDIFDLWAYNYKDQVLWKKYCGLLEFRKKININTNYIITGLKGDTHEFAKKLDKVLSFRPNNSSFRQDKSNDQMW